jgi:putative transferase (TIGR04331 family)
LKKYNLSLTDNLKTIDSQENLIGLVPLNNQDNLNYSYEKIDFPYLKDSEILERYKSCRLIFNRILPELAKTLNNIHNINLSDRAWNIILGTWLMNYISIFYKIYSQMKYIKKNYNIKKIYSLDFKNFDFSVDDTLSFIMAGSKDNQWFFLLSAKLFSEFFKDVELAYNPPSEKSLKKINIDKINKNSFKSFNFFFKISNYLVRKLFNYNNKSLITKTALPYLCEKKLQFKVDKLIIDWSDINLKYSLKNKNLRSKISVGKNENYSELENFLRINIKEFLPKFALENFKDIKKIAESELYPKSPKFIFTSISYAHDECFKIYTAMQSDKKVPYYVGQHGQNYFSKIGHIYFQPELTFSDNFLTWGFSDTAKLKKNFNFKVVGRSYKFKDDGNLVIFFPWVTRSFTTLHSNNIDIFDETKNLANAIQNLNPEIRKKTIIRLNKSYYENFFGIRYFNLFKDLGFKFDDGKTPVKDLIKDCRLSFYTYDSTGVLENLALNVPTIFLNNKEYKEDLTINFKRKYELLYKNEIMFLNKKKLIEHINLNWNEIDSWWMKNERQLAISEFNKNFNLKPSKNSINNLAKNLISI